MHHFFISQGIDCQRYRSQRRLKFMRHVIDKIILDLAEFFLFQQSAHRDIKSRDDHQRKKYNACNLQVHLPDDDVL